LLTAWPALAAKGTAWSVDVALAAVISLVLAPVRA
jgi:hypothetical protein